MSTEVTVADVCEVVSSIQRVVADFYGPQCSQTLLTSPTGKAVVTSDGFTILEALQPAHPIAILVFKALKGCHSWTLDGSKMFLLYLSNMIRQLSLEISLGKFCYGGMAIGNNKHTLERQGTLCARKYLRIMIQTVLPELFNEMQCHGKKLASYMLQHRSTQEIMKCVLKTSLMPHYSLKMCDFFADLLISSLSANFDKTNFPQMLQFLVDKFFSLLIKSSSCPYGDSTVVDMLLIRQKFRVKCEDLNSKCPMSVLIFSGKLDGPSNEDDSRETVSVKQGSQLAGFIQSRRKVITDMATKCRDHGISLMICTEGVPAYAVDIFREYTISLIAYTSKEDTRLLEYVTGKLAVTSVHDDIENSNIISIDGVTELVIGRQQFIQLSLIQPVHSLKHLVVCSPTVGLCDQLAIALQKAVNSLKYCFPNSCTNIYSVGERLNENKLTDLSVGSDSDKLDDHSGENFARHFCNSVGKSVDCHISKQNDNIHLDTDICLIEGGGAFEILLSKLIKDFRDKCVDPNLALMCRVLEESLIGVLHKLFVNVTIEPEAERHFLEVKTVLEEKLSSGELWSLDRRGLPCRMADHGVLEPLLCKIHVVECVLSLVEQILGIDNIVSVRKIKD